MIELFNFRIATMHTIKTCDLAGHGHTSLSVHSSQGPRQKVSYNADYVT